ncbi:Os06g0143750, partial [Oryza sativa Japonica Group]
MDDPEQSLELLQRHDDRRAAHESRQRRLRQEIHDEPQPEEAEGGLEDAGEEGGGEGELEVEDGLLVRRHRLPEHRPHHQRRYRHRPYSQIPRATQQRVDQRRHEARICIHHMCRLASLALRACLRDGEAGNGEAGDDVGAEEAEAVVGAPMEDGEEVLQREHQPPRGRLVLELVERVVGEEHLRQPLPQRLRRRPPLRHRHLVQLRRRRRRHRRRLAPRRRRRGDHRRGRRRLRRWRLDVVGEAVHLVVDNHG